MADKMERDLSEDQRKKLDAAKAQLAANKEAREKQGKEGEAAAAAVKPTPTQEENDLAAMGVHVPEKEPDGSQPVDPNAPPTGGVQSRQMAPAGRGAGYETRAATPQPSQPRRSDA